MSRYVFINNTFGVTPSSGATGAFREIFIGETIADSPANALANGVSPGFGPPDIVAPNYTTAPDPNLICPLDASAAAAIGKTQRTFAQLINPGMNGLNFGFGIGKQ
jgi:hypothetical protein